MKLFLLLFLLMNCSSYAIGVIDGQSTGNGGDSIVCEKNGQTKASIYDYYEGKKLYQHSSYNLKQVGSVEEKLEYLLKRLSNADPYRAKRYRKWYNEFWSEAEQLYGQSLIDIPDTGLGFIPSNCKLVQTIVQVEPSFTHRKRYYVNMDIWNLLDDDSKVGFYLHEFILRDAIAAGQKNSISTRFFNALIAGGYHSNFQYPFSANASDYTDMLRKLGFAFYEIGRIPIPLNSLEAPYYFIQQAGVKNTRVNYFSYEILIDELVLTEFLIVPEDGAPFRGKGKLILGPRHNKSFLNFYIHFIEIKVFQDRDSIKLKVGTTPSQIYKYTKEPYPRTYQIDLKPNTMVHFGDDGLLKELFAEKLVLSSRFNNEYKVLNNVKVTFNKDGTISSPMNW